MNIASYLPKMANKIPYQRAVVFPHSRDKAGRVSYTHLTFLQLNEEADRYAHGLTAFHVKKGMRVLFMVRPSLEFIALTFSLFKIGAVPILIDPGMGKENLLHCIAQVEPEALIAIPMVHLAKFVYKKYFKSVRYSFTLGRRRLAGAIPLHALRAAAPSREAHSVDPSHGSNQVHSDHPVYLSYPAPFEMTQTKDTDTAAILFTTGSTGPPKGVIYQHGLFDAQVKLIQQAYNIKEGEIDLPGFPLFALFSVAMGMTAVIPDMDPTKPALVDPQKIVEAVHNHGVTNSFGSPALWRKVTEYCLKEGITLPSMKRILMAGAPVSGSLHERFTRLLPKGADTHTPYGATEALPVCSISGSEVLRETEKKTRQGAGTCVGLALPSMHLKIIAISDTPIATLAEVSELAQGQIGEIIVCGPTVTHSYYNLPEATALHKIREGERIWHRLGDVGYQDDQGRLWFCGRKAHRVITEGGTLFTIPCEAIFNQHPDVYRSALVGIGPKPPKQPVIIVEPRPGKMPGHKNQKERFIEELKKLGRKNPCTRQIGIFLFHPSFPVDIRHNAKIFREKLALWAEERIRKV